MISLLTYKTPKKFANAFKVTYAELNLRQVRPLSFLILIVTVFAKTVGLLYPEQVILIKNYDEHLILNFLEIGGSAFFFVSSCFAIKSKNWSERNKHLLTLGFIAFILSITLSTSYIVSSYNTKNTLLMLLVGIVGVGLFFVLEYKKIVYIALSLAITFFLSMILPKISFEDKLLNSIVGLVLAFFLISISRYTYYYRSQNFVKLKELEDKNTEIEQLNRDKESILHYVAHDLRSPLNNIEALTSLMLSTDNGHIEAEMIASSAKQAKEIINDLLEGVKSNQDYLSTKEIDISRNLVSIIQRWIANTKREINFVDHNSSCLVKINPSKLERVIDNILSNCIKFSPKNQPINVVLVATEKKLSIKIQDFGIGIPSHLLENVFDQFSKSGRVGLEGEKSTGLGLHISKKIIEEHNGELLIASEENSGTTFEILLPIA